MRGLTPALRHLLSHQSLKPGAPIVPHEPTVSRAWTQEEYQALTEACERGLVIHVPCGDHSHPMLTADGQLALDLDAAARNA